MIEVVSVGNRWTWRMIGFDGRVLAYAGETFPDDSECFSAARAYRAAFWAIACEVDHRMGA